MRLRRRQAALRAPLVALLLLAALGGCRRSVTPGPYRGAPVVLISIDTLRADHLPAYGYRGVSTPALDAIAKDGVVFENAYAHYPLTFPSHTSMLSGQLPPRHGVRDNEGYRFERSRHPFLPVIFGSAGYDTGGFVSSYVLRAETGLGEGWGTYESHLELVPGATFDSAQRPGAETAELALRWLGDRREKFFLFLHLYEPHVPYAPPEPFRSRHLANPYDGEIEAADAVVGRLVAELERRGVYDRAVVILASDHGEGLGDHGEGQHGVFLYRSTLHVPLVVKLPENERAGTRVSRPVGLVDIAPTLATLAGIESQAASDGRSLFDVSPEGEAPRTLYAESYYPRLHYGWSDLQAAFEERWAYVDAPEPELYDLAADPGQLRNVLVDHRRDYLRLRDRVSEIDVPLADPVSVDPAATAQFAALGYLTGAAVRRAGPLPDPKSQRHLLVPIEKGILAFVERDFETAANSFRSALEANDQMLDVWSLAALALSQLQRHEEAAVAYRRAFELSGGATTAALPLAEELIRLRRFGEARSLVEVAHDADPKAIDDLLARIDLGQGRSAEAYARMERAAAKGRATEGIAYKLALRRLQEGRSAEAAALLEPFAARAEPTTLATYAHALSEQGRQAEALGVLERALTLDPRLAELHELHGIVLLHLDRAAESRAALERAIALDPKLPDAWNTLGVARFQLEGPKTAIAAWQRAVALDPELWDAHFNLGLAAANAGAPEVARQALRRFLAGAPDASFAGDKQKARELLRGLGG